MRITKAKVVRSAGEELARWLNNQQSRGKQGQLSEQRLSFIEVESISDNSQLNPHLSLLLHGIVRMMTDDDDDDDADHSDKV